MNLCMPYENGNDIDYECAGYYKLPNYEPNAKTFKECEYFEEIPETPLVCKWIEVEGYEFCSCKEANESSLFMKKIEDL